jgi:hypothetical protein
MKSISRRRVLLALGAMPVIALSKSIEALRNPTMTVGQAMHYLCEEVFPTSNEKGYRMNLDPEPQGVTRGIKQFHIASVKKRGFA